MNEDLHRNRPPDEEHDPLLEALRQRLGVGFGQEPSPELWAGIQEQLPAGAPRPWWLRARRLLPLLAGLLLVSLVLVQQAKRPSLVGRSATSAPASQSFPATPPAPAPATQLSAGPATARVAPDSWPGAAGAATRRAASPGSNPAGKWAPGIATTQSAQGKHLRSNRRSYSTAANAPTLFRTNSLTAAEIRRANQSLVLARNARHRSVASQPTAGDLVALKPQPAARVTYQLNERALATGAGQAAHSLANTSSPSRRAAAHGHQAALARLAAVATSKRPLPAESTTGHAAAAHQRPKQLAEGRAGSQAVAFKKLLPANGAVVRETGAGTLAMRQVGLLLPTRPLPASLAARPDSFAPRLAPVRRWAVVAVAGPTLSYRTLPVSNLAYSSSPATTAPVSNSGTRSNTSYTDLEQPAAGLGAQVQVRRVLSGRWALALGLGYQEYATRISTSGSNSLAYTTSTSILNGYDSTKIAGNLRDTYRLLTLPVQLSYALGPPHGRVALGLLGGLEPGWYLGGQSAEASSCHCQQQSFTSASASPYNTFTLGVNLGLDVRLHLGAPASRWQLVLQPTGRYVATSFVRSTSIYARRQPYSLGILAGVAWTFE